MVFGENIPWTNLYVKRGVNRDPRKLLSVTDTYSAFLTNQGLRCSMLSSCTNRKRSYAEFSRSKRGTINNILEMRMLYFQKIAFIHFEFQQKTRQTTSCERTAKTTTTSSLKSLRKHQRSNSRDC